MQARPGYRIKRIGPPDACLEIEVPDVLSRAATTDAISYLLDPTTALLREQVADLQRQLAERDAEPPPLSPDPVKHMIPDEIRKLMLDDETLPQARQRLWPVLNAELSELKNQEALFNKTIPRRAEVEQLISILARLGEG